MKYYYNITNKNIFSVNGYDYPCTNEDYEITEDQYNEFFDKLNNFYDVAVEVIDGKVKFTYTKNETSYGYLLSQIEAYKQKLSETDYVITKIAEAQAIGDDIGELINQYSEVIANRRLIRTKINELEAKLKELN